jgi:hypothetical protein
MVSGRQSFFAVVFLSSLLLFSGAASAVESLGTFTWQLFPFCNVLTLTIVSDGPIATVSGYDNGCGAGQRQAVVGSAFPNPDGTVGIGVTILSATGLPSHVQALIAAGGASGTWKDEGGQSGAFQFNPGSSPSGSPRPQVVPVSDVWHEIGAPGEPPFGEGWKNDTAPYICSGPLPQSPGCPIYSTAGFYKDPLGIVHLKGTISFGQSGSTIAFRLPPGYRTTKAAVFTMPTTFNGRFVLYDGFFQLSVDGGFPPGTKYFSLDGISFRADN